MVKMKVLPESPVKMAVSTEIIDVSDEAYDKGYNDGKAEGVAEGYAKGKAESLAELEAINEGLDAILVIQNDIIAPEITFAVYHGGYITLTARKGMTWGEWVDTEYNTFGLTNGNASGENVGLICWGMSYVHEGDNSVAATDIIIADYTYEIW